MLSFSVHLAQQHNLVIVMLRLQISLAVQEKLLDMAFSILTIIQFCLTSGQVPHLRFYSPSPQCISLILPDTISSTPKKFCSVHQINVARDQVQLSMIFERKRKDLECTYFKCFWICMCYIAFMCYNTFFFFCAVRCSTNIGYLGGFVG